MNQFTDDWPGIATLASAVFVAAAGVTAAIWKTAPRLGLLAHPNARSSHAKPTASAGGLGFIAPVLAWLVVSMDYPPALVLLATGAAIAVLGLVDDVTDVHRGLRLGCHLALAAACVLWLFEFPLAIAGIFILGLAWWVNVYNFMDGIDGIAASQAVAYAAGALLLGDLDHSSAAFAWVLLAAALGFLGFNWAPAKVFMGDTGSGFLGLTIGVFALWLWQDGKLPFVASAILLVTFWFDASYTLFVRFVTGQAFADAHRAHLYQVVSRRLGHGPTTALFWLHAVAWLAPLAGLATAYPRWQLACLATACLPIGTACAAFRAGTADAN